MSVHIHSRPNIDEATHIGAGRGVWHFVHVCSGARIGTIGAFAFDGACAVVQREVPGLAAMAGVPARQSGWISAHGAHLESQLHGETEATCPHTGVV